MKRPTAIAVLSIAAAMLMLVAATLAPQAHAKPGITYNSECGAPGYGKQWVAANGRAADEPHAREGAPGVHVNAAGYWAQCAPPAAPRQQSACNPPADGAAAFRSWAVNGHTCTTASTYASNTDDPARDRVLPHGSTYMWQQWMGPMRGRLLERCNDGQRTVVGATCAPATHCDTLYTFRREAYEDGKLTSRLYMHDGRQPGAAVPLGSSTHAKSADGRKWPLSCIAGDWEAPNVLPRPVAPAASLPAPVALSGCGRQTIHARGMLAVYTGPRVAEGGSVVVRLGLSHVPAWCRDGRLSLVPPTVTPGQAASASDSLRNAVGR